MFLYIFFLFILDSYVVTCFAGEESTWMKILIRTVGVVIGLVHNLVPIDINSKYVLIYR